MQEADTIARAAYAARFADSKPRDIHAWPDLSSEAREVWSRVASAVLAALTDADVLALALERGLMPEWRGIEDGAPKDGTHFLGLIEEPPDDCGYPGYREAREMWWKPRRGFFGEEMPWCAGGPGHDGDDGAEHYGGGLVTHWQPLSAPPLATGADHAD